jgi:soluble lytic murein transglycosylase-like protein
MPKRFNNTLSDEELDKLFCSTARKFKLKAKFLKAVAVCESSLNERAYRFEPAFFEKYLKDKDEWKDKDPREVSASFGLCQLMFTTAWGMGYRGDGEGLYDPVVNVTLGARYIRKLIDKCKKERWHFNTPFNPLSMAMARYNGGSYKNPDKDGWIRNEAYVKKIFKTFRQLKEEEEGCD